MPAVATSCAARAGEAAMVNELAETRERRTDKTVTAARKGVGNVVGG